MKRDAAGWPLPGRMQSTAEDALAADAELGARHKKLKDLVCDVLETNPQMSELEFVMLTEKNNA